MEGWDEAKGCAAGGDMVTVGGACIAFPGDAAAGRGDDRSG